MLTRVLDRLCAEVPPLTLVSDPDGILADEVILAELNARGIRVISEADPVALRYRYHQLEPITAANPVIVITPGPLNRLPYDLWQPGRHITLALHALFPNLDYPTLRLLSPASRSRLTEAQAAGNWPRRPLSPSQTTDFLLTSVFDARAELLRRPAGLLLWLARYHAGGDPLPAPLAERLVAQLQGAPDLAGWPVGDIITKPDAYRRFVQDAWGDFVSTLTREAQDGYETMPAALDFAHDSAVQDAVPALVRAGALAPVTVDRPAETPVWARPAIALDGEAARVRQLTEAAAVLGERLTVETLRWEDWSALARRWAQLNVWRGQFEVRLPHDLFQRIATLQEELDARFAIWLKAHYTALATRRLPQPHHLWHVPAWLEHCYGAGQQRIALVVLDGMAWSDWLLIRETWGARHSAWDFVERSVLAQIPSVTSVSRQALITGQRPMAFPDTLAENAAESQGWAAFWRRAGISSNAIAYTQISERSPEPHPAIVDSRRIQAICMVNPAIDDMLHGATQGLSDVLASVRLWLNNSQRTEQAITALLRSGFTVTVTSDHGHVAAIGMGQPSEGVTVASRGKRARLYSNADFARAVQAQYPETVLWHDDDVLPTGWWALMPSQRRAFVAEGMQVVSHGGTTFEELIVPVVTITTGNT